jgi:hypothetical protein
MGTIPRAVALENSHSSVLASCPLIVARLPGRGRLVGFLSFPKKYNKLLDYLICRSGIDIILKTGCLQLTGGSQNISPKVSSETTILC